MIRINLLPQARKPGRAATAQKGSSGNAVAWAVLYVVAFVLWSAGLGVVYFLQLSDLSEQQRKNEALEKRIDTLEEKSEGLDKVKAKLAKSRRLEKVVGKLNEARTGPTRVLAELSQILSSGGGPTIDPDELAKIRKNNPLAGYNRSWDVRRLWLSHFEETDRECRIAGRGKTNEDVAEFLRRLSLSELFHQVTLTKTEMVKDRETELELIGFELTCKVRY